MSTRSKIYVEGQLRSTNNILDKEEFELQTSCVEFRTELLLRGQQHKNKKVVRPKKRKLSNLTHINKLFERKKKLNFNFFCKMTILFGTRLSGVISGTRSRILKLCFGQVFLKNFNPFFVFIMLFFFCLFLSLYGFCVAC